MKRILSAALLLVISLAAFAQKKDTTFISGPFIKDPTSKQYSKRFMKQSKDRLVLDLNATNWIQNDPSLKTKAYSRGFNFYFMWDFQIKHSFFSIAPGLGVSQTNVYTRSTLVDTGGMAKFTPIADPSNIKTNKLTVTYLEIPLEFRFRTKPDKLENQWKFVVGFKAGVRVDGYTKTTTKDPKQTTILKPYPDLNLFRCGPTLRIGYSAFNITAYYGVLGLFKKDKGPQINEFSVGISFNGL
ncbi:MAG TPA: porin family protein [Chitinophagales bacterium]